MAVFALIHSPFVGPLTWRPTARALEQKGHIAVVPALGRIEPPYWPQYANLIAEAIRELRTHEPLVLVAHSAAGLVMPGSEPHCMTTGFAVTSLWMPSFLTTAPASAT
jgi:alpha-beta hydrolase superfamily lysophospholipase